MTEHVFGLTVSQVMAYTAVVNILLVLVLAAINIYYAGHAKRQADASREQVTASNRQADIAQKTLDILQGRDEQQRRIDEATVGIQLVAAIRVVEDWQKRILSEAHTGLPDVIEIRTTNFSSAIQNASRIDRIVAGYMGAALFYIERAETDIRLLRDNAAEEHATNPLTKGMSLQSSEQLRDNAMLNLKVARSKLGGARTRLREITVTEAVPNKVTTNDHEHPIQPRKK